MRGRKQTRGGIDRQRIERKKKRQRLSQLGKGIETQIEIEIQTD